MDFDNAADAYEDIFIKNRMLSLQNSSNYMYAKVIEIFRYEGLPPTLPKRILEGAVTRGGGAVVYEYEGELFVTDTLPGGQMNLYGEATEVRFEHRVGNVQESLTRTIGVDAVLVRNDAHMIGLDPIITEYSIMQAQAKITMVRNFVDLRGNYIIQAKDENAYRGAEEYLRAVNRGDLGIILAEEFAEMDGIVVHSTPISNNPATQTIELFQYVQSLYYSELGITLNNNMKREYVSDSEIEKSSGMPLIYNMLACRQEAVRDIKALFGVDITVSLSSEWNDEMEADNEPQVEAEAGEPSEAPQEESGGGGDEPGTDAPDAPEEEPDAQAEEPQPQHEPEVEEVSSEELIEATEALIGEEVDHGEEADGGAPADSGDAEADSRQDDEEGAGVAPEEGDDED